jgi:hypothetical protein
MKNKKPKRPVQIRFVSLDELIEKEYAAELGEENIYDGYPEEVELDFNNDTVFSTYDPEIHEDEQ